MGFFDSVKKSLGLASMEMEMRIQPESAHVDGELKGELVVRALKDIEIFGLDVILLHGFKDEWGNSSLEVFEKGSAAEMISMRAGEEEVYPFFIEIPAMVAPSIGPFSWKIRAQARLKGAADVKKEQNLHVHFSPIMGAIFDLVKNQFGFVYQSFGAEEDCLWAEFVPSGAVKNMYRGLEIAFDEQPDDLVLWVSLHPFSQRVLQQYSRDYDPSENSIEIEINKRQFLSGSQVNTQGLLGVLQPLFSP